MGRFRVPVMAQPQAAAKGAGAAPPSKPLFRSPGLRKPPGSTQALAPASSVIAAPAPAAAGSAPKEVVGVGAAARAAPAAGAAATPAAGALRVPSFSVPGLKRRKLAPASGGGPEPGSAAVAPDRMHVPADAAPAAAAPGAERALVDGTHAYGAQAVPARDGQLAHAAERPACGAAAPPCAGPLAGAGSQAETSQCMQPHADAAPAGSAPAVLVAAAAGAAAPEPAVGPEACAPKSEAAWHAPGGAGGTEQPAEQEVAHLLAPAQLAQVWDPHTCLHANMGCMQCRHAAHACMASLQTRSHVCVHTRPQSLTRRVARSTIPQLRLPSVEGAALPSASDLGLKLAMPQLQDMLRELTAPAPCALPAPMRLAASAAPAACMREAGAVGGHQHLSSHSALPCPAGMLPRCAAALGSDTAPHAQLADDACRAAMRQLQAQLRPPPPGAPALAAPQEARLWGGGGRLLRTGVGACSSAADGLWVGCEDEWPPQQSGPEIKAVVVDWGLCDVVEGAASQPSEAAARPAPMGIACTTAAVRGNDGGVVAAGLGLPAAAVDAACMSFGSPQPCLGSFSLAALRRLCE